MPGSTTWVATFEITALHNMIPAIIIRLALITDSKDPIKRNSDEFGTSSNFKKIAGQEGKFKRLPPCSFLVLHGNGFTSHPKKKSPNPHVEETGFSSF
jgi:hypothetical protein